MRKNKNKSLRDRQLNRLHSRLHSREARESIEDATAEIAAFTASVEGIPATEVWHRIALTEDPSWRQWAAIHVRAWVLRSDEDQAVAIRVAQPSFITGSLDDFLDFTDWAVAEGRLTPAGITL